MEARLPLFVLLISLATFAGGRYAGSPGESDLLGQTVADIDRQLSKMTFPTKEELKSQERNFAVDIEGIVGTGKSTFLKYFKETYVQATMLENHLRNISPAKIQERSVHSARYVFSEYFYRVGKLQPVEYTILDEWFKLLSSIPEFHLAKDLTVYLRNDPAVALERVRARGRPEEASVRLDFLQGIHNIHEDWLIHRNTSFQMPSPNILVVDATQPLEKCEELYKHIAKRISQIVAKFK